MTRMAVLILLMLLPATVVAQPAQPAPSPAARPEARERIKQRVRALRAYTLTEELALDEQTAAKLFPTLAKFDEQFDRLLAARVDLQRRLDGARDLRDPKAVDKLIDEAVANQRALWDTEDRRLAQLRKILTPAQTARVIVVLPRMERKIQNRLRRAVLREQRRGQPLAPRLDSDDDDGDEDDVVPAAPPRRGRQKAAPAAPR